MHLVAALLSLFIAYVNPPGERDETPIPHQREGDWARLGHSTPTALGSQTFVVGREVGWFSVLRIDRL